MPVWYQGLKFFISFLFFLIAFTCSAFLMVLAFQVTVWFQAMGGSERLIPGYLNLAPAGVGIMAGNVMTGVYLIKETGHSKGNAFVKYLGFIFLVIFTIGTQFFLPQPGGWNSIQVWEIYFTALIIGALLRINGWTFPGTEHSK